MDLLSALCSRNCICFIMSSLKIAQQECELIYLWQPWRGQHFFHTFEKSLGGRKMDIMELLHHYAHGWALRLCVNPCVWDPPVWGCWHCCEEWSYWAVPSGSPALAWSQGLGRFGPPRADCCQQEDSLQWLSRETTRQASNDSYYQEELSREAWTSSIHRMFTDR